MKNARKSANSDALKRIVATFSITIVGNFVDNAISFYITLLSYIHIILGLHHILVVVINTLLPKIFQKIEELYQIHTFTADGKVTFGYGRDTPSMIIIINTTGAYQTTINAISPGINAIYQSIEPYIYAYESPFPRTSDGYDDDLLYMTMVEVMPQPVDDIDIDPVEVSAVELIYEVSTAESLHEVFPATRESIYEVFSAASKSLHEVSAAELIHEVSTTELLHKVFPATRESIHEVSTTESLHEVFPAAELIYKVFPAAESLHEVFPAAESLHKLTQYPDKGSEPEGNTTNDNDVLKTAKENLQLMLPKEQMTQPENATDDNVLKAAGDKSVTI
ncbi:LOW QUALITY PROTEIN: hypothetical protein BC936DRAFT_146763 [Jimgerdemannia flammicorona]|uniref:Uncharacterized protein n=1 Tax=Jimgerdemannia flammicorona TaxID=994334 RepID=A0A433DLF9_9FUNG|nr:LOW QUALITY PROTEIN: hypothetical protein BC936DRAFT_146763 [Jimgerdemannia flammicorona]